MVREQLEESLRHELENYVEERIGGIKREITALQSQLNESLNRLVDRQGNVQLDASVATSILEHLRAAQEEGIDLAASDSSRAKASSDMAIVKAAISEIDEQQSQAGILKVLVNRGASFAPRIAFFVIKGDQGIGWRARGFQGTVGDQSVHQMSFPLAADTAVGQAARSRKSLSGGHGSQTENHLILNRFGGDPPTRIVAVPLVVSNRAVAVLYADSADLDSDAINLEALETLVRVSGMAVELLVARAAPAAQPAAAPAPSEPSEADAPPAYTPAAEYDEITPVVEESAPPAEVAVAEAPPEPPPVEPVVEPQPYVAEIEAAPVAVEEPVASPVEIEAEMAPPAEAPAPATTPRRRYGADVELPVDVASEEERRLHNDARRFARLLVSEIKLYNEQKVVDGRANGDLYQRLQEYIVRSREMYDKRVKPEVAQRYDYFHHELVNTLAEGDAAKLGSAYPGAVVSA